MVSPQETIVFLSLSLALASRVHLWTYFSATGSNFFDGALQGGWALNEQGQVGDVNDKKESNLGNRAVTWRLGNVPTYVFARIKHDKAGVKKKGDEKTSHHSRCQGSLNTTLCLESVPVDAQCHRRDVWFNICRSGNWTTWCKLPAEQQRLNAHGVDDDEMNQRHRNAVWIREVQKRAREKEKVKNKIQIFQFTLQTD